METSVGLRKRHYSSLPGRDEMGVDADFLLWTFLSSGALGDGRIRSGGSQHSGLVVDYSMSMTVLHTVEADAARGQKLSLKQRDPTKEKFLLREVKYLLIYKESIIETVNRRE